ncbi:membrane protein [Sulfuricaulis limicola]|uniref:Protein HflK n=1 Tax=Sulfuricaulis limicola TaxID=1620215 RepID=A0A1B4XFP1_9GAMM|nr:FtsH protease activity modulator HflK [Sulfuricaulis limicola]BAV33614.1 membrane protein [Sulfuricaulis limicola]
MAWNEPGKPGDKDPWGQRRKPGAGGPDIDRIVKDIQQKFAGLFGGLFGGGGRGGDSHASGFGFGLILVVALMIWLATGFYVVNQGERGVVLRFGKETQITDAGLRWHLPFPLESVEKVNVEKVSTIEIGYRSNPRTGGKSKVPKEALMLTEDENIIDIEFAVQYKIKDAAQYLFNVRDPETTIAQATESAVREVVGKSTLDFALTEGRDQVSRSSRELLQQILDRYNTGVHIVTVETQKAQPPDEVKPAFDDAVKAREDEQRLINEAEAYANDVIPRARGGAARLIQEAEGYKSSVIARADGDARRFSQIANEYVKAPAVTRERLYIETMEQVLSSTTTIFIDQKAGNNLIYLPLDKLVPMGEAAGAVPYVPPLTEADATAAGAARNGAASRGRTDLRSRGATP